MKQPIFEDGIACLATPTWLCFDWEGATSNTIGCGVQRIK